MSEDKLRELQDAEDVKGLIAYVDNLVQRASEDKKIEAHCDLLKKYVKFFDIKVGYFMCEGPYGRAVAQRKEVTLFNSETREPVKFARLRKHLHAKHTALRWAVTGYADD